MSRTLWAWGRYVVPVAVLAVLVWRLGTGPFLDGIRTIDGPALAAATGLVVLTTVCSAWRWKIVAGGLRVDLSLPAAVAAYYRALFLNVTLPGGVVGEVHRGISHGRDVNDVGRALRSVAWERTAGLVVQVFLSLVVLLALPSPVQSAMPLVAIVVVAALFGVVLIAWACPAGARSAWARTRSAVARDIRHGLLARRAWPRIALASALVVAGHAVITRACSAPAYGRSPAGIGRRAVPPGHRGVSSAVLRPGATSWSGKAPNAARVAPRLALARGVSVGLLLA